MGRVTGGDGTAGISPYARAGRKNMEVPSPAVTRDDSSVSAMIGGTLDFRALSVLRQAADPDTLDAGVRHLAAQGLTVSDVASTLSLA